MTFKMYTIKTRNTCKRSLFHSLYVHLIRRSLITLLFTNTIIILRILRLLLLRFLWFLLFFYKSLLLLGPSLWFRDKLILKIYIGTHKFFRLSYIALLANDANKLFFLFLFIKIGHKFFRNEFSFFLHFFLLSFSLFKGLFSLFILVILLDFLQFFMDLFVNEGFFANEVIDYRFGELSYMFYLDAGFCKF